MKCNHWTFWHGYD